MSRDRWITLEPLIDAALDLPRDQRQSFMDEHCAGDAALREELTRFLTEYDEPDTLLQHPAAARFAALLDDRPVELPAVLSDRYRLEGEIGRGGMATVYLAHDLRHDRKVAVKVLHAELAAAVGADRFLAEIRTTARLHHPHILPLHDSGEVDGVLYYVMPYVEGESLRQRMVREKQLSVDDAVRIACEVAGALESAHAQGVIHRDIKPENVLLQHNAALVADFGIALAVGTAAGPRITNPGLTVGTPQYMSPEQATGAPSIDRRSDIYSLGAVLYEMLAGEPPFTGTSTTAIVAKLIAMPAPSVRIVRAAIPMALDAAIARSLAREPADRYRSAAEFAETIQRSLVSGRWEYGHHGPPVRATGRFLTLKRVGLIAASLAGFALAGHLMRRGNLSSPFNMRLPSGDTTRVAIMPFDPPPGESRAAKGEDLLFDGMQRWRGIDLVEGFEVADAVRRHGSITTNEDARAVAASVGAGRYVRGRFLTSGVGRAVRAVLYDVGSGAELHHAQIALPNDSLIVAETYAALADSVLMRGRVDSTPGPLAGVWRTLPAAQAFRAARAALREWDLEGADSLFGLSVGYEPALSQASLWLAQVRAWRALPSSQWLPLAERAALDTSAFSVSERRRAAALLALAQKEYPQACARYREIVKEEPSDFSGWYGLAQCHEMDRIVVRDSRSPSGWRYRSSYHQAILAYTQAFKLLPSAYRGFQGDAYVRLRRLLFTSTGYLRAGTSLGSPPTMFLARPSLDADTIVFVPFPPAAMFSADPRTGLAEVARAVTRLRRIYQQITGTWVAAFPRSGGAKEAFAISLEIAGEAAAIDSFEVAKRLTKDAFTRLRLATSATWMRVKVGIPDRPELLQGARHAADSVLRSINAPSAREAEMLGRLATLLGHCDAAAKYARLTAVPISYPFNVPGFLVAQARALRTYTALGCRPVDNTLTVDWIAERLDASGQAEQSRLQMENELLGGIVRSSFPIGRPWVLRLVGMKDYLLLAEQRFLEGRTDEVRQSLDSLAIIRRTGLPGDVRPDGVLAEARLLLAMRDTVMAIRRLDVMLSNARFLSTLSEDEAVRNMVDIASVVRAMALRAELAGTDRLTARRWSRAVVALWSGADEQLQPMVRRMAELAR